MMKFIFLAIVLTGFSSPLLAHQSVLSGWAHEIEHSTAALALVLIVAVALTAACAALVQRRRGR